MAAAAGFLFFQENPSPSLLAGVCLTMAGMVLMDRPVAELLRVRALKEKGLAAGTIAERVSETVLPNGLKVLLLENHKAPVLTFQVWYRVGSRNERPGETIG